MAALFRQQTNILVRGSENNAIYFSFLLAIFHSIMCVLQSSSQARKQEAAASSNLMYQGQGATTLCQVTVNLLDALAQQVCSKTGNADEFKSTKHGDEQTM